MMEADNTPKQDTPNTEPVWTFRGYSLKSNDFVTSMVHFFRAEVSRANAWRQRLDTTTNWAIISTSAVLSVAFSQPNIHHGIVLLNILLVSIFLYIEARRYRYYELWSYRIRLMETDFFGAMLVPPFSPSPDWAEALSENLLNPRFPISFWEAFGRRLRRNYIWIFLILGIAWVAKYWLFPVPAASWQEVFTRASIGSIPGKAVILFNAIYFLALILLAILTASLQQSSGEILPRFGFGFDSEAVGFDKSKVISQPWFNFKKRRAQYIAFIITDKKEQVYKRIIADLKRGVTAVDGKGMFTEKEHTVLMCAITVTEINNLKKVTGDEDPNAFVIVSPAQEILGRGFLPLNPE
jgi:uncharacterized membrane protein